MIFSNLIYAQNKVGITFGSNISYLTTDSSSVPLSYSKLGPNIGIFWNFPSGYQTYIEVGAYYSLQGAKFKSEQFIIDRDSNKTEQQIIEINDQLHYIKIPILWKQDWGDWYTKIGFYGEFAPLAYSSWKHIHIYSNDSTVERGIYPHFSNSVRTFDIGLNLSMGIETAINNNLNFILNVQYNMGLFALNPDEVNPANRMYNRFFTISTGIVFARNKYKYRRR
jgi:hypothetical protein